MKEQQLISFLDEYSCLFLRYNATRLCWTRQMSQKLSSTLQGKMQSICWFLVLQIKAPSSGAFPSFLAMPKQNQKSKFDYFTNKQI